MYHQRRRRATGGGFWRIYSSYTFFYVHALLFNSEIPIFPIQKQATDVKHRFNFTLANLKQRVPISTLRIKTKESLSALRRPTCFVIVVAKFRAYLDLVGTSVLCSCDGLGLDTSITAKATFYGNVGHLVKPSGACGYGEYGRTVNSGAFCGVSKLYNNGTSCGAYYQMKCKHPDYCNEEGTVVVVTDSGEEKADFILSFSAYAKLAKPIMVAKLIGQGEVEIEYQRVPCKYATGAHLVVKVHESSNFPNYLAIVLLNKGGLSDIMAIEVWEESHKQWKSMVRMFGAVWAISDPPKGALKFRFQVRGSAGVVWVQPLKLIPSDWKAEVLIDTFIQLT
ncbi:expansin-like B1 [Lycium ferocissimum]|uniref:expansin-like B1 n=1 Tax=Lycium ferocissimum TaxID=112874 RepID=UPI0028166171|nr:expansin-like B1 [Lycium ferocissimum]